jgi:hypothetical protein
MLQLKPQKFPPMKSVLTTWTGIFVRRCPIHVFLPERFGSEPEIHRF